MGLYNFQRRFVAPILAGDKTHTIRAPREYMDYPGATMHLYTGLRQKGAKLIFRAPCVQVDTILIYHRAIWLSEGVPLHGLSKSGWAALWGHEEAKGFTRLDPTETDRLAQRDGFFDFLDMETFWMGRLPFYGGIWHWDYRNRRMK